MYKLANQDISLHSQLPAGAQARYIKTGNVYILASAITDADGNPINVANPLPISTAGSSATVTYGALVSVAMGNGSAKQIVPANANRATLIITNVSDIPAYLSIGDNTVTSSKYTFILNPQDTLIIQSPITTQAIWAASVSAIGKNLAYQEAV